MCSDPKVRGGVWTVSDRAGAPGRDGVAAHGALADCSRTAPLLGRYNGDRGALRTSGSRPPSPYRSLAALLHVTKQNPQVRSPAQPLCVRHRIRRRRSGKAPPPARLRVPPRGGRRRSPKVPRPPAAAASRTPRPGLLVQQQLRLLGSSRHLSLCGKTRPFRGLGASLGRSSPGPSAAGRVPPQLLPPPSVPPPPRPGRPKRSRGLG